MASAVDIVVKVRDRASGALGRIAGKGRALGGALKIGAVAGAAGLIGLGVGLTKIGLDFDKAFDKIKVGTGATGPALEGVKEDFRRVFGGVPTDMAKASTAIADLNTRLGLTGKPLQQMSKQVLELSRLTDTDLGTNIEKVSRLFGDWAVNTEDQSDALDRVFKTSQATGPSVDRLAHLMVAFGAPLRQLNFSFEESAALMGKWEKEGVNTELVMGSLKIAIANFAREGVPLRAGLDETIRRIQELGPGAEATGLAMETFGARAGGDMAAAILEGKFAIEDLMGTLDEGGAGILETAKQTESFGEKLTRVKNQVILLVEPLAVRLVDALGAVATMIEEDVAPAIDEKLIPALKGFWETHGPLVIGVLGQMGEGVLTVKDAVVGLGEWVLNNKAALVAAIGGIGLAFAWTNPAGAVLLGIGAIITAVGILRTDVEKLPVALLPVRRKLDEIAIGFLDVLDTVVGVADAMTSLGITSIPGVEGSFDKLQADIARKRQVLVDDIGAVETAIVDLERPTLESKEAITAMFSDVGGAAGESADEITAMRGRAQTDLPLIGVAAQTLLTQLEPLDDDRFVSVFIDDELFRIKLGDVRERLRGLPKEKEVKFQIAGRNFWVEAGQIEAALKELERIRTIELRFKTSGDIEILKQYGLETQIVPMHGGGFVPPGVVQPAVLHGGPYGEAVIPLDEPVLPRGVRTLGPLSAGSGRRGGVTVIFQAGAFVIQTPFNLIDPVDQLHAAEAIANVVRPLLEGR